MDKQKRNNGRLGLKHSEETKQRMSEIKKGTKRERAEQVGALIAQVAAAKKIDKVVFDRSGFRYMGRVKLLAEAARKGGLKF